MPDLSQSPIRQIAIVCTDVARGTAFYRDTLGMRFLFAAGPTLSFFDCGGIRLMLSTAERPEDASRSSILYYLVSDIEGTHRELGSKGVTFGSPPHMIAQMPDHQLWLAEFHGLGGQCVGVDGRARDQGIGIREQGIEGTAGRVRGAARHVIWLHGFGRPIGLSSDTWPCTRSP